MYAMHVIPEWIERPDLLFGVEIETVFAADASVFAQKEEARLDFVQRHFALVDAAS